MDFIMGKHTLKKAGMYTAQLVTFNGIDDVVTFGDILPSDDEFTIAQTINLDDLVNRSLWANYFNSSYNGMLYLNSSSVFTLYDSLSGSGTSRYVNFTLSASTQYRVVSVINGTTVKIYIDGTLVNTITISTSISGINGIFQSGRRGGSSHWFKGLMGNFTLTEAVWTQADVTYDYANQDAIINHSLDTEDSNFSFPASNVVEEWGYELA